MDAVGGEEAVLDALPQAVGVERVAEVDVGVAVVLAQAGWRSCRAGRPARSIPGSPASRFVTGAAPVALVHDDQVEEVRWRCFEQALSALVLSHSLVEGKVHLPAVTASPFSIL